MENRIKMDDLGVPLFLETSITIGQCKMIIERAAIFYDKLLSPKLT